jgi:hypothetical protein
MKTRNYLINELEKRGYVVHQYNLSRWISGKMQLRNYRIAKILSELTGIPVEIWMDKCLVSLRTESLKSFSVLNNLVLEGRGRDKDA